MSLNECALLADDTTVGGVLDIVEAMLVHHDRARPDAVDTGMLAPVIPLPSTRG